LLLDFLTKGILGELGNKQVAKLNRSLKHGFAAER
jgi:hypothetical protein